MPQAPRRTVLAPPPSYDSAPVQPTSGEKRPYKPFGAAYHGVDQPPPAAGQVNSVGLQQADQTKAKSKYGKLGNTVSPLSFSYCFIGLNECVLRWRTLLLAALALVLVRQALHVVSHRYLLN